MLHLQCVKEREALRQGGVVQLGFEKSVLCFVWHPPDNAAAARRTDFKRKQKLALLHTLCIERCDDQCALLQ